MHRTPRTLLGEIEAAWLDVLPRVLLNLLREHPDERLYASAFWLLYCDYREILVPAFGANSEGHVRVHGEGAASWSNRWVPAEWRWPVLDEACDALKPLYQRLSADMNGATEDQWKALLQAQDEMLARISRTLTAQMRSSGPWANDYVVAVLEDRDGAERYNALVRASVDANVLPRFDGMLLPAD